MRRILIAMCMLTALPLSACATTSPSSPAAIANATKVDEQTINTLELAYKTWRIAVETGVRSGAIKGTLAATVAGLDTRLYSALQAAEHAYEGGNGDFGTALVAFNGALSSGYAAIGGK
jgi:hypothetical protein